MTCNTILSSIYDAIVFPMKKEKTILFCLPFAGGSAPLIYNKWIPFLSEDIILKPIELAGRGSRIQEPFYTDIDQATDDIYNQLQGDIAYHDYAIFGHSMGALLTYKVMQKLKVEGQKMPIHAFFSGRPAPSVFRSRRYSELNDEDFKKQVMALGATPPQIFENPEFLRIFLPILRHDFRISETRTDQETIVPFDCDLTVLIGEDEPITRDQAIAWQAYTHANCSVDYIRGGHFFLLSDTEKVLDIINAKLKAEQLVTLI